MSTELAQLEEAFQLVREDPSSALSLTLLKERVRPYADSSNRDVSELADAVKNLLTQVNSGIVNVSDGFLPLLDDIETYFKRNHDLQISLDKANDLLGKIDYEASGGNATEPTLDLTAVKPKVVEAAPVSKPAPEQTTEITYEIKPIQVREGDESSSELEKVDRLLNVQRRLTTNLLVLSKAVLETENRHSEQTHEELQTQLAKQLDRLELANAELEGATKSFADQIEAQSRIAHQKIEKQLRKLFKGSNCSVSIGQVQMYQSLWAEIMDLLDHHFRADPSTRLKSIAIQPKGDEIEISATFEGDTQASTEKQSTLRTDFGKLGAKVEISENESDKLATTISIPSNNRIVSVLLAIVNADWMAIPTHSLIRVEPVTKKLQTTSYGEIVYKDQHFLILQELRTRDEPQYYVLMDCDEGRFAIPTTMVKPDQKIVLREASIEHARSFGANIINDNQVCLYPDLNQLRRANRPLLSDSLKPHILAIFVSEQHLEFTTQICSQFGVQVTCAQTIASALTQCREFRPLATILFKYLTYDESVVQEDELAEYAHANRMPLAIYTTGKIDPQYATVLTEDILLHDFLCDVCGSDQSAEEIEPSDETDQSED